MSKGKRSTELENLVKSGGWSIPGEPVPATGADLEEMEAEYRLKQEKAQRELLEIADKLANWQELNPFELARAAFAIRESAARIPMKLKKKVGTPGEFSQQLIIDYLTLVVRDGFTRAKAVEELAKKYKKDDDSGIRKYLKRHGTDNHLDAIESGYRKFIPKSRD